MGTRIMTDETKAKIAATREANKAASAASGAEPAKRATVEEQIAAVQALAESGDAAAAALLPAIDAYQDKLRVAKNDLKSVKKRLRKLLAALKD